MSDLPSHPETQSAGQINPASEPPIRGWSGRRKALLVAAVVGLTVLFVVLHLTGVVGGGEGHS